MDGQNCDQAVAPEQGQGEQWTELRHKPKSPSSPDPTGHKPSTQHGHKRQVNRDNHQQAHNQQQHQNQQPQPASSETWAGFDDIANVLAQELDISMSGFGNEPQNHYDFSALPNQQRQQSKFDENYKTKDENSRGSASSSSSSKKWSHGAYQSGERNSTNLTSFEGTIDHGVENSSESYKKSCLQDFSERGFLSAGNDSSNSRSEPQSPESLMERSPPQDTTWSYNAVLAPALNMGSSVSSIQPGQSMKAELVGSTRAFHYTLGAPTAICAKTGYISMTYLNQSQSYEVRLKRVNEVVGFCGSMVRSAIRLSFMDRRLQFREKDEVTHWQMVHPRDRLLDIDLPLSYGIFEVTTDPLLSNSVEFTWDSSREASIFVRVNCISTEFTSKRHGGERGVALKFVVETSTTQTSSPRRLDIASSALKVFKSKGADRKHKTDREKYEKYSDNNKNSFLPSFDCTVFADVDPDHVDQDEENDPFCAQNGSFASNDPGPRQTPPSALSSTPPVGTFVKTRQRSQSDLNSPPPTSGSHGPQAGGGRTTPNPSEPGTPILSGSEHSFSPDHQHGEPSCSHKDSQITPSSSSFTDVPKESEEDLRAWLLMNRFDRLVPTFVDYKFLDLVRLSKEDLMDICGSPDGIRLFNALHSALSKPVLTMYVAVDETGLRDIVAALSDEPKNQSHAFNALYLEKFSTEELIIKLSELFLIEPSHVHEVFMIGPGGIRIRCNDKVVGNINNEAIYTCEYLRDKNYFILRSVSKY